MSLFAKPLTALALAAAGAALSGAAGAHEVAAPHAHVGETAVVGGPVLIVAVVGLVALGVALQRRARLRAAPARRAR